MIRLSPDWHLHSLDKAEETSLSFDGPVGTHSHPLVVGTTFILVFRHVSATNLGHCHQSPSRDRNLFFRQCLGWHHPWVYLSISDDASLVHQSPQRYQRSERSSISLKMFCLSSLCCVDDGLVHLLVPPAFNILLSSWWASEKWDSLTLSLNVTPHRID